jgi:hypothetical protein
VYAVFPNSTHSPRYKMNANSAPSSNENASSFAISAASRSLSECGYNTSGLRLIGFQELISSKTLRSLVGLETRLRLPTVIGTPGESKQSIPRLSDA